MFSFIKSFFSRRRLPRKTAGPELRTLDGIPISQIRAGDTLEWTEDDGRKMSGTVTDRYGCLMVQTDMIRCVDLPSVITKSKFVI